MATTGQDGAKEDEFKEISLIFQARQAQPLSETTIPELQKVIPMNLWKEFAQASADVVKSRYFLMFLLEFFGLTGSLVKEMNALCLETNKKIAQETEKFVGPNAMLEFRRKAGTRGPTTVEHGGGYRSTRAEQDYSEYLCWKNPDEFTVVVKYRRAAFFKS